MEHVAAESESIELWDATDLEVHVFHLLACGCSSMSPVIGEFDNTYLTNLSRRICYCFNSALFGYFRNDIKREIQ